MPLWNHPSLYYASAPVQSWFKHKLNEFLDTFDVTRAERKGELPSEEDTWTHLVWHCWIHETLRMNWSMVLDRKALKKAIARRYRWRQAKDREELQQEFEVRLSERLPLIELPTREKQAKNKERDLRATFPNVVHDCFRDGINKVVRKLPQEEEEQLGPSTANTDDGNDGDSEHALDRLEFLRHWASVGVMDPARLGLHPNVSMDAVWCVMEQLFIIAPHHFTLVLEMANQGEVKTTEWYQAMWLAEGKPLREGQDGVPKKYKSRLSRNKYKALYRFLVLLGELEERFFEDPSKVKRRDANLEPERLWGCFEVAYLRAGIEHHGPAVERVKTEFGLPERTYQRATKDVAWWSLFELQQTDAGPSLQQHHDKILNLLDLNEAENPYPRRTFAQAKPSGNPVKTQSDIDPPEPAQLTELRRDMATLMMVGPTAAEASIGEILGLREHVEAPHGPAGEVLLSSSVTLAYFREEQQEKIRRNATTLLKTLVEALFSSAGTGFQGGGAVMSLDDGRGSKRLLVSNNDPITLEVRSGCDEPIEVVLLDLRDGRAAVYRPDGNRLSIQNPLLRLEYPVNELPGEYHSVVLAFADKAPSNEALLESSIDDWLDHGLRGVWGYTLVVT